MARAVAVAVAWPGLLVDHLAGNSRTQHWPIVPLSHRPPPSGCFRRHRHFGVMESDAFMFCVISLPFDVL